MLNLYIMESDFAWHRHKVRTDYAAAQRPITLQGIRTVVGHILIRVGTLIEGKARQACQDCAETGRTLTNAGTISLIN